MRSMEFIGNFSVLLQRLGVSGSENFLTSIATKYSLIKFAIDMRNMALTKVSMCVIRCSCKVVKSKVIVKTFFHISLKAVQKIGARRL